MRQIVASVLLKLFIMGNIPLNRNCTLKSWTEQINTIDEETMIWRNTIFTLSHSGKYNVPRSTQNIHILLWHENKLRAILIVFSKFPSLFYKLISLNMLVATSQKCVKKYFRFTECEPKQLYKHFPRSYRTALVNLYCLFWIIMLSKILLWLKLKNTRRRNWITVQNYF